jgi:hypothetical protein
MTAILAAAVLTLCGSTVTAGPTDFPDVDVCAAGPEGWEKAAETPSFLTSGRTEVDRLLVCDRGVYFFFKAREWGNYIQFCVAHPNTGDFIPQLREVLGSKYAAGVVISFEKDRWRPYLEAAPGHSIEFTWRRRTAFFTEPVDVYYPPPGKKIPGWLIFILLVPGHA